MIWGRRSGQTTLGPKSPPSFFLYLLTSSPTVAGRVLFSFFCVLAFCPRRSLVPLLLGEKSYTLLHSVKWTWKAIRDPSRTHAHSPSPFGHHLALVCYVNKRRPPPLSTLKQQLFLFLSQPFFNQLSISSFSLS